VSAELAAPLAGRTALVTGAGRGIGRGIALALAAAGAAVAVNYRSDADAAAAVVAEIVAAGGEAAAFGASVAEPEAVERLADEVLARFERVDAFVSNAGTASRGRPIDATEPEEFEALMRVNVIGPQRLLRRLLPGMRAGGHGSVIAISSSEVDAMPAYGGPYNAAKAALDALALTLAHEELAHGVRVNIVAPGLVLTDMGSRYASAALKVEDVTAFAAAQPFGRVTAPADIGDAVVFLASDAAAMVTGQRLVVDGGVDNSIPK
jgi:NAD(P)-dependent dehydrogenase (short-subunit alcohol dehydrogenase family)